MTLIVIGKEWDKKGCFSADHLSASQLNLSPSLWFSTGTEGSMFPPETANQANKKRQATLSVGKVTITIT